MLTSLAVICNVIWHYSLPILIKCLLTLTHIFQTLRMGGPPVFGILEFKLQSNLCTRAAPWDLKKVAAWKRCLIKLRFKLAVNVSNWPLLTGSRYSQVAVNSGLTVYVIVYVYWLLCQQLQPSYVMTLYYFYVNVFSRQM